MLKPILVIFSLVIGLLLSNCGYDTSKYRRNIIAPSSPMSMQYPNVKGIPSGGRMAGIISNYSEDFRVANKPVDRENYANFADNPIKLVRELPVSTFSIDVDTGSYSNVRRILNRGSLPRHDAIRVEEMINYFSYQYLVPENRIPPFTVTTEIAPTPWNENTHLLHIGIKGFELAKANLPPANLVFLLDVSGSMMSPDKLDLLKSSLKLLANQLTEKDKVTLVVYAGASGLVLEPTPGNKAGTIIAALDRLQAGGSTNGGAGIQLAYAMAKQAYIEGGINRVLLATDGDFNVGTVNFESLKNMIEEQRKTGISLTTLGFGTGNYNDHLMEQLADAGNGNYAYIDTLNEAQKVLVDEMSATLNTIAKDVKIQVEFNPNNVAEYRLIGYENRKLKREDFDNDKVDAGEIGAGHTVTALYEIALVGSKGQRLTELRYADKKPISDTSRNEELVFLRLRYKAPDGNISKLLEWTIKRSDIIESVNTSTHFRFSAAVAAFGQQLRGGKYLENFSYNDILTLARSSRGEDNFGYRGEFINLVNLAKSLSRQ
ncbi:MAG: VWA domain-containing protein [Thiomargarita sp.]|nr:VWA domain-containing protein [Thiomargarita sp.]